MKMKNHTEQSLHKHNESKNCPWCGSTTKVFQFNVINIIKRFSIYGCSAIPFTAILKNKTEVINNGGKTND